MTIIVPYSEEWWEARRGKITASSGLHTAVHGTPQEKNALLDELETQLRPDFVWPQQQNKYQAWGHEQEPKARALIELLCDCDTYEPGLVFHKDVPILAATPDFAVPLETNDGVPVLIAGEIKCPYYLRRHYQLAMHGLQSKKLDEYMQKYYTQVQGQALILNAEEGWFFSFHPDAPPAQRLYRELVPVNYTLHETMLSSCAEMADMLKRGARYGIGRTLDDLSEIPQVF